MTLPIVLAAAILALAASGFLAWQMRKRHIDRWIGPFLAQRWTRRRVRRGDPVHLIFCIADHYEPKWNNAPPEVARGRVEAWVRDYPRLFGEFRDSDGRPPRHSFFYPADEYEPEYLDSLAGLCRDGFGEIEIHLHHDDDTAENLRKTLLDFKRTLAERHGLLARDPETGEPVYAFIHGNWALDNSRPDGRMCGVNNELDVLRETGCYADLTMPSAPSATQTRTINSIYYAVDDPERPKSHDTGVPVGSGPAPPNALLMIQGPLVIDWRNKRIENGCLQGNQPAHVSRLDAWLSAGVQVPSRPDWFFVKLYSHGATESNQRAVLGPPMVEFHRSLAQRAAQDKTFQYHYVTAREMYNLVRAAEQGWRGTVAGARDHVLKWESGRAAGGPP